MRMLQLAVMSLLLLSLATACQTRNASASRPAQDGDMKGIPSIDSLDHAGNTISDTEGQPNYKPEAR